jgi:HK97 gp10 family phage protein
MGYVSLSPNLLAIIGSHIEVRSEVEQAAQKILAAANAIVPVDTGALQASGHVDVDVNEHGQLIAHVIYSTSYAVYVEFGTHDTPTFAMLRRGAESAGFKLSKGT